MSYSLDVNLLLYSSDTSSPFHDQARSFLQSCMSGRDILYLGWPTIMSLPANCNPPVDFR